MAEWVVCPTCNLKHTVRSDRTCPRCREAIDRTAAPPPVNPQPPEPDRPSVDRQRPPLASPPESTPFPATRCESCGKVGPVGRVEFHQTIGAVIVRFHKSVKGNLCPECAGKHFWSLTLTTLAGGWWGIISFVMTPFILIYNVLQYLSYKPGQATAVGGIAVGPPDAVPVAPSATTLRNGFAIASLCLGLVGLATFGLIGVGAIIGIVLGGIAIWRATQAPTEYGGRGIAIAGIILNVAGGVMAAILGVVVLINHSAANRPQKPGEAAFQAANGQIVFFHGDTAFGNTPEARDLAARYGKAMEGVAAVAFTGGRPKGRPSFSEGRFLTYCERRGDRICFLVHVPELRNYRGETRDALLKIAWVLAKDITKETRKPSDLKLGVGLRGAVAYGATAIGMGEGSPDKKTAEVLDDAPLYEFFVQPAGAQ
jgi:hypothetical protein